MKENKNDMFEISRDDIVQMLTKDPRFSANGVNFILDKHGIVAMLEAVMCEVDSLSRGVEYYKKSYRCVNELLADQSAYVDKLEKDLEQLHKLD